MCRLCDKKEKIGWEVSRNDYDIAPNGMWYLIDNVLWSDNSCNEYEKAQLVIKYCPLCGKKLIKK